LGHKVIAKIAGHKPGNNATLRIVLTLSND